MSNPRRTARPGRPRQNGRRINGEARRTANPDPTAPESPAPAGPDTDRDPGQDAGQGAGQDAGVWAARWERFSRGQYLITGVVLCALSLIGHAIPASGPARVVRTVVCLALGVAGALVIVVPWVGRLRARAEARTPSPGPSARLSVDERLRNSPYPKALWVYSAWITVLSLLAVLAFLALAIGRHSPGFILGLVVFGIPAILFGSLIWTTRDIWSRA